MTILKLFTMLFHSSHALVTDNEAIRLSFVIYYTESIHNFMNELE